jgi:DNA-binding beta-propeller fold protein YncE
VKKSILVVAFGFVTCAVSIAVSAPPGQKLLVASYLHDTIMAYDAQTGASLGSFISGTSGGLAQPAHMLFGPQGDLFVGSSFRHRVYRYDGQTGQFIQSYLLPNNDGLRGIAFGTDGKMYVSDITANAIQTFDPATGNYLGAFATLNRTPIGLAFGKDGFLYAAYSETTEGANNGRVQRFDPVSGQDLGAFGPTNLDNPQSLIFGPDNNLYVHIQDDHDIIRINGLTGALMGTFVSEEYPFNPSAGFVFGPDGHLYAANLTGGASNDGVRRYNGTTGAFINNFVPGDGNYWASGIAFTPFAVPEPSFTSIIALGSLSLTYRRRRNDRRLPRAAASAWGD